MRDKDHFKAVGLVVLTVHKNQKVQLIKKLQYLTKSIKIWRLMRRSSILFYPMLLSLQRIKMVVEGYKRKLMNK